MADIEGRIDEKLYAERIIILLLCLYFHCSFVGCNRICKVHKSIKKGVVKVNRENNCYEMKKIGLLLKEYRERYSYTLEELATYFDGDTSAVENWENGVSEPSITECVILSNLYNVPLDEMFEPVNVRHLLPKESIEDFRHESWINHIKNREY